MKNILRKEAMNFASFLHHYKIDYKSLNRVVENDSRSVLIELSKTNNETFFNAIMSRDWNWLTNNLIKPKQNSYVNTEDTYNYSTAQLIVSKALQGNPNRISREDLRIIYNNIFQDNKTEYKFTRHCTTHGIEVKQMKIDGSNVKGVFL